MVNYQTHLDSITADRLQGFFVGWPNPPRPETHLQILQGSSHVVLAIDREKPERPVVGFISAISDGILTAHIPLLEVLPLYQGRGIGRSLTRKMLTLLTDFYAVDLMCDDELIPFYERFAMQPAGGMIVRNYQNQSGDHRQQTTDFRTNSEV
ncbi:MAG: GNAT family N-acetyltransferase [Ardenticatenaceae bacterium]|nr:GNAT family N-acetyltransferase [Ardenticatenaceae bacterium]